MARGRRSYGRRGYSLSDDEDIYNKKEFKATFVPGIDAYKVSFPYNKNFIDTLKERIPDTKRELDFDRERDPQYIWTITTEYFEDFVLPLARIVFFEKADFVIADKATVESFNQGSTLTTEVVSTDVLAEKFYKLLEKAGLSLDKSITTLSTVKKYYFKASKYFHPDVYPERAKDMSELNYLWSNLKGTYFHE